MDGKGYGYYLHNGKQIRAHRLALHIWTGFDLDSPLEVMHNDDICISKLCCEYTHLKPGTHEQNLATAKIRSANKEKTHCIHGHELKGTNIYWHNGKRLCADCRKNRAREKYRKLHKVNPAKFRI